MASETKKPARWRHWPRLLFLIPFTAMLWVSTYNRTEPELGGIPFFYWYQLLWILLGSAIVLLVYMLDTKISRGAKGEAAEMDTTGVPGDIL
jgi:cell division protein FtsW (lipid II flippase)